MPFFCCSGVEFFIAFSKSALDAMIGYRAELLPDVCDIFADAERAGKLRTNQTHIAEACRLLSRGLTRVGIIGLVDEATGYQNDRAVDALAEILERFIAKELRPWIKTFPEDFYRELCRLRGLEFPMEQPNPIYSPSSDFYGLNLGDARRPPG